MLPYLKNKSYAGTPTIHSRCWWLLPWNRTHQHPELPAHVSYVGSVLRAAASSGANSLDNQTDLPDSQAPLPLLTKKSQPSSSFSHRFRGTSAHHCCYAWWCPYLDHPEDTKGHRRQCNSWGLDEYSQFRSERYKWISGWLFYKKKKKPGSVVSGPRKHQRNFDWSIEFF